MYCRNVYVGEAFLQKQIACSQTERLGGLKLVHLIGGVVVSKLEQPQKHNTETEMEVYAWKAQDLKGNLPFSSTHGVCFEELSCKSFPGMRLQRASYCVIIQQNS